MPEKKRVGYAYEAKQVTVQKPVIRKKDGVLIKAKEPDLQWHIIEAPIVKRKDGTQPKGVKIAVVETGDMARRIAACLNASEHLETEELAGAMLVPEQIPKHVGNHSAEPWCIKDDPIAVYQQRYVRGVYEILRCFHFNVKSELEAQANAKRIVACVNACAGIPTETLSKMKTKKIKELSDGMLPSV